MLYTKEHSFFDESFCNRLGKYLFNILTKYKYYRQSKNVIETKFRNFFTKHILLNCRLKWINLKAPTTMLPYYTYK